MFKINPMPPPVDGATLDTLKSLDVPDLGHIRHWGFPDPRIKPVVPGHKIVGTAVTVIAPALDSSIIPHALGSIRPGDILVIDRLGDVRHACMGGVVALAAKIAGAAGIIVDGYVTDFEEIRSHGLPVWCRGEASAMSKLLAIGGAMNVPICCGGAAVSPGDALLADDCGICVLPPDEIAAMHTAVTEAQSKRPARLQRILAGEKLGHVNGVSARIEAGLAKSRGNETTKR